MADDLERRLALFFELHSGMIRQAPGSTASTRHALGLIPDLPPAPRIIDFGCGPGASSLVLARQTGGHITAIDTYQPYLDTLAAAADRRGLSGRITPINADMANPPVPEAAADLIWSEGAVYCIGFAQGLRRWRSLLRPEGAIAITEAAWLTDSPPEAAARFWAAAYPAMTTLEGNQDALRAAGYRPIAHFILPAQDWRAYYGPLQQRIRALRRAYPDDPQVQALAAEEQAEIDLWRAHGESYGYVFYIATRGR